MLAWKAVCILAKKHLNLNRFPFSLWTFGILSDLSKIVCVCEKVFFFLTSRTYCDIVIPQKAAKGFKGSARSPEDTFYTAGARLVSEVGIFHYTVRASLILYRTAMKREKHTASRSCRRRRCCCETLTFFISFNTQFMFLRPPCPPHWFPPTICCFLLFKRLRNKSNWKEWMQLLC